MCECVTRKYDALFFIILLLSPFEILFSLRHLLFVCLSPLDTYLPTYPPICMTYTCIYLFVGLAHILFLGSDSICRT